MNLQAVIDDSYDDESGIYVLAGYIAPAENWSSFSKDWKELLPSYGILNNQNQYHFKMSEMALNPDRRERVVAFYRIIEKYVTVSISVKINVNDLKRAQTRIFVPNTVIEWGVYSSPFYIAFRCLMDKFHIERQNIEEHIPKNQKIDFTFDQEIQKKHIHEFWDEYIKARPKEIKSYYGKKPEFKDDNDFLPLQAADFWAWWVRKWYKEETPEKIQSWDFEEFKPAKQKKYLRIEITFDQDQLIESMMKTLRDQLNIEKPIIDLRFLDQIKFPNPNKEG